MYCVTLLQNIPPHLETLALGERGEQPAPGEGGAARTGVGDEVVEGDAGGGVAVPPRPEPDPEPEDEDYQEANCHQKPQHCLSWYFCFNLQKNVPDISELETRCMRVHTCVVNSSRSSFIRVKDTILKIVLWIYFFL